MRNSPSESTRRSIRGICPGAQSGATTGKLTYLGTIWDSAPTIDGLDGIFSATASPDGKHVYTASYIGDTVAMFDKNANSGNLIFREVHKDGENGVGRLDGGSPSTCRLS